MTTAPSYVPQSVMPTPQRSKGAGAKNLWVVAVVLAVLTAVITATWVGSQTRTQSYWVLGQAVPARTQITPKMLVELKGRPGGVPPQAYGPNAFTSGELFSEVSLRAGDVLSPSVVGPLTRLPDGLPKTYTVASLKAQPEAAIAGRLRRGDYVDIYAVSQINNSASSGSSSASVQQSEAVLALRHVLVLDVTADLSTITQGATSNVDGGTGATNAQPGPESSAVRGGIPQDYLLAVTPADAAKIALLTAGDGGSNSASAYLTLSPEDPAATASATTIELLDGKALPDSGAGTVGVITASPSPGSHK